MNEPIHGRKEIAMEDGIGNCCVRDVITVGAEASVAEAAALMRQHHIGALVIVGAGGKPVGMLTDRDIVIEVVAAGLAPQAVKVTEIVQRPLVPIADSASLAEAVRLMSVNGVRRMPVVDANGGLVGIIALDDILRQLVGPLVALADLTVRERRYESVTRP
jgi:CBS domain-containing protein